MILGWRALRSSHFTGFNVFRAFDWSLPVDELGRQCFRNFDDGLAKMKNDPHSTRIAVPGQAANHPLTRLNTANKAALRSVPDRFRKSVWMWTVCVVEESNQRTLWSQLPKWCRLTLESESGELNTLSAPHKNGQWSSLLLTSEHRHLHLNFVSPPTVFTLERSVVEECGFIKASELLRTPSLRSHAVSLRLDQGVEEVPDLRRFEE